MALNNIGMGMTVTATNLASRTLGRVSRDVASTAGIAQASALEMRAGFGVAAVGALGLVAGVSALRGAIGAANSAGVFQQNLAAIGAISRASAEEMALLRDTAIQAGVATQFSPTEAVEGLTSLVTAGQTARDATESLVPVLDLAAGSLGQLGVAGAAEAVVGTLNSYQLSASEAGNVTDRLLRITQLSNFQARDFAGGLAKAASAGAVFGQDLNDVLVTMGLLRNANIDASSSSTAFRESVRRLGSDQRAQHAVTSAGVNIFDEQTGNMRSVVDIMSELTTATADMGDEERNRIAATAFGARGLLAFNAVSQATFKTLVDGREVTLRGTEAIAAMRDELEGAEGTAAAMRDQMLDTFAGQKQLLKGTLDTLAIVLGESFARIFKPIVENVVNFLNKILVFFNELPDETKDLISKIALFTAGMVALFSAITLVVGIMRIFRVLTGKLRVTLAAMSTSMLPLIAVFGVITGVISIFAFAASRDVGSFGQFMTQTWEKVKLGLNALVQAFSSGRFSGAVLEELNKVENSGVKQFVITVFGFVARIKQFFGGIADAIGEGFDAMAPMFRELRTSMTRVGDAFARVTGNVRETSGSFADWSSTGRRIGEFLMPIFRGIVAVVIVLTDVFAGLVRGWASAMEFFEPVFEFVRSAFDDMMDSFNEFGGEDGLDEAGTKALTLGEIFGAVFGGIVAIIGGALGVIFKFVEVIIHAASWIWDSMQSIWGSFVKIGLTIQDVFLDVTDYVLNAIDRVSEAWGDLIDLIPEEFRTEGMNQAVVDGLNAEQARLRRDVASDERNLNNERRFQEIDEERAIRNGDAVRPDRAPDKITPREIAEALRSVGFGAVPVVQVILDGEAIARSTADGARDDAARGFTSAPSETGS